MGKIFLKSFINSSRTSTTPTYLLLYLVERISIAPPEVPPPRESGSFSSIEGPSSLSNCPTKLQSVWCPTEFQEKGEEFVINVVQGGRRTQTKVEVLPPPLRVVCLDTTPKLPLRSRKYLHGPPVLRRIHPSWIRSPHTHRSPLSDGIIPNHPIPDPT